MKQVGTSMYLLRDNKVLFLVRNKKNDTVHRQGMYLAMGGKVENGEGTEECIVREVAEEASVQVNSLQLKAIHYIRQLDGVHDDWVIFMYTSDDFSGEPIAGNEGHFEWVEWDDFEDKQLYGSDREHLRHLREYDFHVTEFTYDGFNHLSTKLLYTSPA